MTRKREKERLAGTMSGHHGYDIDETGHSSMLLLTWFFDDS